MQLLMFTGLLVGAAYGYVAQRGAFCMNSGFRVAVTRRDTTKLKAYGLAIAVQMVAVPILFWLWTSKPTHPSFFPVGAILGGLLFGASMKWAGGCAAGVWYKVGTGSVTALAGIIGMALGAAAFEVGPLSPLRSVVQSLGADITTGSLHLGSTPLWVVAPGVGLAMIAVSWRAAPGIAGSWSWRRTGVLMGAIGVVAWPLSSLAARDFGMAVVPGTVGMLTAFPDSLNNLVSWDVLFVLGIPAGGFIGARRGGSSKPTRPPVRDVFKHLLGGMGLGSGASLAAGCTVGHGLTGIPLLAPGSLVAMASIFAGSALVAVWHQRRAQIDAIRVPERRTQ